MRIAIVGSGVTGLGAAAALAARHDVEIFEADDWIGGHTHTIVVPGAGPGGAAVPVDTGFIIHNRRTYPRFTALVESLGVPTRETEMSFSLSCRRCRLEWASTSVAALFAQRRRLVDPRHWALLGGTLAFFARGHRALQSGEAAFLTLGEALRRWHVPRAAIDHFVLPMGAAIWSAPAAQMLDFPAESFLRFYANHGMMGWTGAPRWRTIVGGSRVYVDALVARHGLRVHVKTPVRRIERDGDTGASAGGSAGGSAGAGGGVTLVTDAGARRFDRVIVATHTDQALALLAAPSAAERRVLGGLAYTNNDVWLHTDDAFLPAPRARASWNYQTDDCRAPEPRVMATYWMNSLQGLPGPTNWLVTLNPTRPVAPARVLGHFRYAHPRYDFAALGAQAAVPTIQGGGGVYFAGAWQGAGFHEDGLRAGQEAASALEAEVSHPGATRAEGRTAACADRPAASISA